MQYEAIQYNFPRIRLIPCDLADSIDNNKFHKTKYKQFQNGHNITTDELQYAPPNIRPSISNMPP